MPNDSRDEPDPPHPDSPRATDSGTESAADPWRAQLGALGGFIRAQRRLADLSLREMAAVTRVSNAYLSQVERGLHQPSLKVLRAIADALGISSNELLSQAGFAAEDVADASAEPARGGDTEAAVLADGRLSESQKAALLAVYRSFLAENGNSAGDGPSGG